MDTSVLDDNWNMRHHRIFHSGYFDYKRTFRIVLVFILLCNGGNIADKEL